MKLIATLMLAATMMVAALSQTHTHVDLRSRMSSGGGSGSPGGNGRWQVRDRSYYGAPTSRFATLDLSGAHLEHQAQYSVKIGNEDPIPVSTDNSGGFSISLTYTTAVRPNIQIGTVCQICDSSGVVIAQAAFGRH